MASTPEMNAVLRILLTSPKVTARMEALMSLGGGRKAEDQQPLGPSVKLPHGPVSYPIVCNQSVHDWKRLNSLHPTIQGENANTLTLQFILKEICKAACLRFMV